MKRLPVYLERERVTSAFVDDEDFPVLSPLRWLLRKPPEYRGNHLTRRQTTDQFIQDLRDPDQGLVILRRCRPYTLVSVPTLNGSHTYQQALWLDRLVIALRRDRSQAESAIRSGHWRLVKQIGGQSRIIHHSGYFLDCRSSNLTTDQGEAQSEGQPIVEPPSQSSPPQSGPTQDEAQSTLDLESIFNKMSRPEGDTTD